MTALARQGDTCGGLINALLQTFVKVESLSVAIVGDSITSHGSGPHAAATLSSGSTFVTIEGVPVCRVGDFATCGDQVTTGSPFVDVEA